MVLLLPVLATIEMYVMWQGIRTTSWITGAVHIRKGTTLYQPGRGPGPALGMFEVFSRTGQLHTELYTVRTTDFLPRHISIVVTTGRTQQASSGGLSLIEAETGCVLKMSLTTLKCFMSRNVCNEFLSSRSNEECHEETMQKFHG